MGSIRKSLEKAGYLSPIASGLMQFIQKRREEADQEEFNRLMSDAITGIRKTYSEQPEENISWIPGGKTRLQDLNQPPPRPELPGGDPADSNLAIDAGFKPRTPDIPIEDPEIQMLGDVSGRKYGTLSADEQRMAIQKKIAETLMQGANLKHLPEGMLERGGTILDLFKGAYTPKQKSTELKEFDTRKDLYEIDDEGNIKLIRPGQQERKDKTIGSYTGKDGYHYTKLYDPTTGTVQEIRSENPVRPPKGTTVKIDYPEPEKWKDFGSVINMISYKTDKDGNIVETTPAEQKQLREVAQNMALGNMLPGAVDFMRTRIWNAWNRENMSLADFEAEIEEGLESGELSAEEAQDLLDYNSFRPYLYDDLIETYKATEEGDQQ